MKQVDLSKDINRSLLISMHNFFELGARRANNCVGATEQEKNARQVNDDGGYKCIHLDPFDFCERLGRVLACEKIDPDPAKIFKLKFIDIGCGVGEKIYLASLFGLTTFGLELREPLIQEGKQLFESIDYNCHRWDPTNTSSVYCGSSVNNNCFIQANALTFDYKAFDILYFYCPLFKPELQRQLEDRIAETAKPGAIVIPVLAHGVFNGSNFKNWQYKNRYFVKEGLDI